MPPADLRRRLDARLPQVVALALSLQLVAAAGAVVAGPWTAPAAPAPAAALAAAPAPVAVLAGAPLAAAPARPTGPVRLSAAGLWDGDVEARPLGIDAGGALAVPRTAGQLGWWSDGPRPGEVGAAVVVGHVDLRGRLGVFGRLATAQPGAVVRVTSGDGEPVSFRVTRVEQYAKDAFPTDEVYAPADRPELRLVTCGGRFDPRTGHYADNVVVVAVRV